jgi:hypothetical protein
MISEQDEGISDAFNKGINVSKGELIGTINSGDTYQNDTVSLVVNEYYKSYHKNKLVFHGNIKLFNFKKVKIYKPFKLSTFYRQMPIWHPTIFVTKDLYLNYRYDTNFKIAMDYDLFSRIYSDGLATFCYINSTLANMDTEGISNSFAINGYKEVMHSSRKNMNTGLLKSKIIFMYNYTLCLLIKAFKKYA